MRSTRAAAQGISETIAQLAAQDLCDSDDIMDITLVDSSDSEAEEYYNPAWHHADNDTESESEDDEDESGEEDEDEDDYEENEQDDDDEDEEDSDDDEPVVVPAKRKRGSNKNAATQEAQKLSRRPLSKIFSLYSNEPWDILKSEIRSHIGTALNIQLVQLPHYNIMFTVPRQVTALIQLNDRKQYKNLVSNALKIKASPSAKILVEPKMVQQAKEKENDDEDRSGGKAKKGGHKMKVRNERDIIPGNVALNAKIEALRDRCPTPGGRCGSEHCFVHPDEQDHFPLSHTHFESWGAAMFKGEEFATINKPPNNELFDKLSQQALAARSPLLQRRLELNQKSTANHTPPQININFPPESAEFLGNPPAPAAAVPPQTPAVVPNGPAMLIPSGVTAVNEETLSSAGPDGWGFPPQTPTTARSLPLAAEAHCVVLSPAAPEI
ncbi:hypothetical protein B0H13DRAFT_2317823 [Mycena leptocephala]|nr:hypothetical protein B0H13DRAFT_2317823 [Mycena leptocephala]